MAHAELYELKAKESRTDALTGLLNRRAYEERRVIEAARSARYGHSLGLCLFDLDGFKAVNDRLGHPAGDEVLQGVAKVIDSSRLTDDAFRIGGDEFAVLMPETRLEGAKIAAERLIDATGRGSPRRRGRHRFLRRRGDHRGRPQPARGCRQGAAGREGPAQGLGGQISSTHRLPGPQRRSARDALPGSRSAEARVGPGVTRSGQLRAHHQQHHLRRDGRGDELLELLPRRGTVGADAGLGLRRRGRQRGRGRARGDPDLRLPPPRLPPGRPAGPLRPARLRR